MKVAVINFSGNVGKTTVAAHLLKPRLDGAPIFSIESINADASADGVDVEQMRGRKFGDLRNQLIELDSAIVDIGASNVEDFLKLMQQYQGSHEEFDLFIIPVVKEKKQQADTINTIRALATIGVPPSKIRVIFNKVDIDESPEDEFSAIFGLAAVDSSFIANPSAVIHSNEVYEGIKDVGKSIADIANDPTDYRAQLKQKTDPAERQFCMRMIGLKMLALTANKNLDRAFQALTA